MAKITIKESTRFFPNPNEMKEFVERMKSKPKYEIISFGKSNGRTFYVKYREV